VGFRGELLLMQRPWVERGAGMRDIGSVAEVDLTQLHLDVYDTRDGPWHPEHGALAIPESWQFLPSGDAFVTRTVKAAGVYWVAWRPRGRNRPHRRKLGLWAPLEAIEQARVAANQTASRRAQGRQQGARQRARAEQRYRTDLAAAIVDFLAFRPPTNSWRSRSPTAPPNKPLRLAAAESAEPGPCPWTNARCSRRGPGYAIGTPTTRTGSTPRTATTSSPTSSPTEPSSLRPTVPSTTSWKNGGSQSSQALARTGCHPVATCMTSDKRARRTTSPTCVRLHPLERSIESWSACCREGRVPSQHDSC
jgi:hypothetical protein